MVLLLTQVAAGQRVNAWFSRNGSQVTSITDGNFGGFANLNSILDNQIALTGLVTTARNSVFNGTTWDRMRGDVNGTVVQGTVNVRTAVLPDGTDRSGTITTAATAQQVAPANVTRTALTFQNTSDTAMRLTESGTAATATTGFIVSAGQGVNISTNKSISVYCAAAGKTFSATETG